MVEMKISCDDALLQSLLGSLNYLAGSRAAPATKAAFDRSAELIQRVWRGWAMGSSIAGIANIKRANSALASSIKVNKTGDFSAEITSDSPYAARIQRGSPAFDMKKKYPYGKRSRLSKKERLPYLIIPFRWGAPSADGGRAHFGSVIPASVYNIVKKKSFSQSFRTGATRFEENARGELVRRSAYEWGDRFKSEGADSIAEDYAQGMVKMKTGGAGSAYFTFRVISVKSPADKWIKKEVAAVDVTGAIKSNLEPIIGNLIEEGLKADLGIS